MREIKFRAWDTKFERMYYDVQGIQFSEKTGLPKNIMMDFGRVVLRTDHIILEQYTGIKDIHGKEIYEGDLMKYQNDYKLEVMKIKQSKVKDPFYVIVKIIFKDGKFQQQIVKQKNYRFGDLPYEPEDIVIGYYEVIGNIHENIELLEEKECGL